MVSKFQPGNRNTWKNQSEASQR